MDEKMRELISKLRDKQVDVSDGRISEIVREARDEAFAEAKAIIKGIILEGILDCALSELESTGSKAVPGQEAVTPSMTKAPSESEAPLPTSQGQINAMEPKEQIQQEIGAIQRQIAENESLLTQIKAPATGSEKALELPIQDEVATPTDKGKQGPGYYIYGIMKNDGSQTIGRLPEKGIDPIYPVYALSHRAIQAVVSKVSLQEFGQQELEANFNNIHWVDAKARFHLSVLETLLADGTVIPMRFCTIYRSERRMQELMEQYYDKLLDTLARLDGKQEWGVKIYCDSEALAQRIGEISDRVKELRTAIAQKSEGAAYFSKKKLEEVIAAEIERISDEYAQLSHNRLSSHAAEAVINSLQDKKITGRKEEMILNVAYLVTDEQLAAFRAELESLEKEYGDLALSYEITGPWPPYNFVAIGFGEDVAHESVSS